MNVASSYANVLYVSLGFRRLTVCCCRILCPARDDCLVCAHVLKLAVLLVPPLVCLLVVWIRSEVC